MKNKPLVVRATVVAAFALICAGCSLGGGVATSPLPEEGANNVTPAQSPQAPLSSGSCANPYLPVVQGATWTRSHASALGDSTSTATIAEVSPNGFVVERILNLANGESLGWQETWACAADGLVQFPSNELAALVGLSSQSVTVNVLASQGVTLPRNIQPGDAWSQAFDLEMVAPDGTFAYSVTYNFTAIGLEQVSVPAGTFTGIKLQNHMTMTASGQTMEFDIDYWFVQGVGLVKYVTSFDGVVSSTVETKSYSIP